MRGRWMRVVFRHCAAVTERTARSFSNDQPVDSIDTEKSRIIVHELEKGWWILAV